MSLFEAIRDADAKKLKKLLKASGDANELGNGGTTPLIEAAGAGEAALVELLLEHGAEPALTDDTKETALMKAAANGHRDVVDLLLPHASPDDRDLAEAYLKANRNPDRAPAGSGFKTDGLTQRAARAVASVAGALGNDSPQERINRMDEAERQSKKKR
jgi:hypothetical protein